MIRMLLVGYCFGIRSERRLCEDTMMPRIRMMRALYKRPPL
jgi:hypothetical protein